MPFTSSTPIRGKACGSAASVVAWAANRGCKRPDDVRRYVDTVYALAPALDLNPDVIVAQSILETSEGGAPWASQWWQKRCNPAGIGITGDPVQNDLSRDFRDGQAAARAHLLHLYLYVHGDAVPDGFDKAEDPRWDAAIDAKFARVATTLGDLTNRWAKDDRYGDKIAERLTALEAAGLLSETPTPTEPEKEIPRMALKAYDVPGLDNPLVLPDDIQVEIKIITHERFRSFITSNAHTKTTFHDTGNPNTTADGEWTWANNGRQGAGVGGYNGIFDSRKIIITQPFDEVVWAAGTPEGNRTSYHFEMAYGGGQDLSRVLEVGYALHGALCAAKGWEVDTALVKHQYWYGKWCPAQILNRGIWSQVVSRTTAAAAASRGAIGGGGRGGAGGGQPDPRPTYAKPAIIAELDEISMSEGMAPPSVVAAGTRWFWVGDRVQVTADSTPRLQRASLEANRVGPDLKHGEEFDVDWIAEYEGNLWYYTPYGTRIFVADTERVRDLKQDSAEDSVGEAA
jgi:hypothetical protein